jgi:hypothetical protein
LQFLQDAHKEALAGLVTNVIPNPLANTSYILSGCKNSTTVPIHTLSAGVLFYNGEIFNFDGATFTLTGLQKAYARIETTQYLTNADPVQFTDGVSRNVHNVRKIVIENTTVSSGLPEFINFINVGQWKDATDALSLAVTTLQATDVSLQNQINVLNASLPKNKGYISGLNLPVTSGSLTVGGDITSATGTASDGVLVTMSNAMPNIDYYVRCIVESLGTASQDQQSAQGMFKKVSTTQFYYIQAETNNATQSLKVHFEAIAY